MSEDIQKDIQKLGDNVKQTFGDLQNTFNEFKHTQEEASKQFLKQGDLDPLLDNQRKAMAEDMVKMQEALDSRMNNVETAFKRTSLGETMDSGDQFKEAKMFFEGVAYRKGQLKAGRSLSDDQIDVEAYQNYKQAFNTYLRGDDKGMSPEEYKSLSVGSDPDGGYTVTPEMSASIIKRQFETSPVRQLANVVTISTDALDILEDPNDITAGWVAETESRSEDTSPQLGKKSIVAHELEYMPGATQKLLDDSFVDIESWLANKIADNFNRTETAAFVTGNGVAKPRGMTTLTAGTTWGTVQQVVSGANGGVTYAGITNWIYSLKENHMPNASVMMHRLLVAKVLALSGNDTPLWIPSISMGQPAMLLGQPVRMGQDLATPATGSLSAIYGDFREGYTIVDRIGVRTLRDPYSSKPFVLFYTTKRVGGDVTNGDALKILKLSAS